MHDYLFSAEIVRFAFVFGVCVSMTLYERLHLTTGSIVVPGYIAVFLVCPQVVIATFVNALLSYALMNHVLRKRFMLYGHTKFTLMALISIGIQTAMLKLSPSGPWLWEKNIPLFVGAGYVVPALIAHDMGRQGIRRTIKAVLLAGAIVALPIALALVFRLRGVNDLAPLSGFATMSIATPWIPVAVLLSAAASWGVARNYGFRSGGFIGAAYVGMFMGDPYQVLVAFAIALVTFVLVRHVLMNCLILFGRRKFSAMLLTSSMISWTLLWVGPALFSSRINNHLDLASMALTPLFVPGLLANDMDRTSPMRVVAGAGLAAAFVVPTTWLIQSMVEGQTVRMAWMLLTAFTFFIIYWKSMRQLYRHYRPVKLVEEVPIDQAAHDAAADDALLKMVFEMIEELASSAVGGSAPPEELAGSIDELIAAFTWPQVERRSADRPWANRPRAAAPEQRAFPELHLVDPIAWDPRDNMQWQDDHPDSWEDADRWLAEALIPRERRDQVA